MSELQTVDDALAAAHRDDWARVVGATVRTVRDLDLAEECVQDAYASALRSRLPLLVEPGSSPDIADLLDERPDDTTTTTVMPDERLRLLLLCTHPALGQDACAALTLRLVCGVSTSDIARLFLVSEPTMAARLTRAKRKIVGSGIAMRLPGPARMPERIRQVSDVVHLLFTAGCSAPSGPDLVRVDLVDEALRLARLLVELVPEDTETRGLLALLLAIDARRRSRTDDSGAPVRLEDQDRAQGDRARIAEARSLLMPALTEGSAGSSCLQAAIAVLHAEAPSFRDTDWRQIVGLYDELLRVEPSPVVGLSRAVAVAELHGPEAGLAAVDALQDDVRLAAYPYLPAARADLLTRLSRPVEAAEAYRQTLARTENAAEMAFLQGRLWEASGSPAP